MEIQEDMPMLPNEGQEDYEVEMGEGNSLPDVLGGLPVQPVGEAMRRGFSFPPQRQPWSAHLGGCFGSHGEACTNVDMEIWFCGTASPYVLYPNRSQRFNSGQGNLAPSQQTMVYVNSGVEGHDTWCLPL